MKQYLTEYFAYNNRANKKLLDAILQLSDKAEALRLFSHLISAQDKWYNRVTKENEDAAYSWYGEVYTETTASAAWDNSYEQWERLLASSTEETLDAYIHFIRPADGKEMKVKLKDIIFQLCCHSVHHRAQINKLISSQGMAVPLTDYIFTKIEEA